MAWITQYQRWLSESESLKNAQMVADHFGNWSNEAIAALCGNMRHESSINPDMYEYGYAWGSNRGYGLVQWTPRSKYWDWAVSRGLSPRLGDSQLARIDYEVEQNIQWIPISRYNGMTFKQFRENAGGWSVDYLTEAFTWCYERPNATAGANSMASRKAFARLVLATVDFSGTGAGGGGGIMPLLPVPPGTPISSSFNLQRKHPVTGVVTPHYGTDFAAAQGTPLYATMAGVVTHVSYDDTRGNYVIVKHDNDIYYSTYQHNVSNAVSVGDRVEQGDIVGYMGETGLGTGVHLHFAVADTPFGNYSSNPPGNFIDPEIYLQTPASGGGGATPTPSPASRPLQPTLYQYEEETPTMTYYQVKAGDSLSAIAKRYGVNMTAIKRVKYETIPNVNAIDKGEMLLLPKAKKAPVRPASTPKTHTVKAGENLSVIAKKYKTTVAAIQIKNGIKNANHIVKGQVLKL